MVDFHMHVLPGMDDGSKDVETSLEMLRTSWFYGTSAVCATSHFYASENTPKAFLARRRKAFDKLRLAMEACDEVPPIRLGAEVFYFGGISSIDGLESLCLEGTNLLLLEMPFVRWSDRMLREVQTIRSRGLQPVAAHIERYMHIQPKRLMEEFFSLGVYIQCNAEFFLSFRTRHQALSMLQRGQIQFAGSDAHNMGERMPKLGDAMSVVSKKLGMDWLTRWEDDAEMLISESERRM